MVKRPGITTDILEDDALRVKSTTKQSNDEVSAIAMMRPKSPDERNLELIQAYAKINLPLPRTAGTDLSAINDDLAKRLKDPVYHKVARNLPEAQRQSRELFKKRGAGKVFEAATVVATGPVLGGATILASAAGAEIAERLGKDANTGAMIGEFAVLGPKAITKIPSVFKKSKSGVESMWTIINNEEFMLSGNKQIDKVLSAMALSKKVGKETEILRAAERTKRTADLLKHTTAAAKALEKGDLEEHTRLIKLANMSRAGEMPRAEFVLPEFVKFSADDSKILYGRIDDALKDGTLKPNEHLNATNALFQMIVHGEVPKASNIKVLERVYGEAFGQGVNRMRKMGPRATKAALDIAGAPINTLSSYDLSAPFRQGYFLFARMPREGMRASWNMVRAFKSEENAVKLDQALQLKPNMARFKEANIYFGSITGSGVARNVDEAFFSSLPGKIPIFGAGIRMSERAYTTFLNQMRYQYADGIYTGWKKANKPGWIARKIPGVGQNATELDEAGKAVGIVTARDMEQLAQLTNYASGRGPGIPVKALNDIANVAFYAPKLATSRFAMPAVGVAQAAGIVKASPAMRRESARMLAQGFGSMLAVSGGLMWGSNQAWAKNKDGTKRLHVEIDPRSTDFGKIRVGKTRIDMMAGYSQVFRFMTQMMTEQSKSASSGNINKKEMQETLGRFLQSKFSPAAGLAMDISKGETFIGEELRTDDASLVNMAWERMAPLFLQDVVEAMEEQGLVKGGLLALPGFVGGGVTSYTSSRDIAAQYLKNDIEMTDENGDRIYDIQDERMTPAQKSQLMNDERIRKDMEKNNEKNREDYLTDSYAMREQQQRLSDESFITNQSTAESWREERMVKNVLSSEVAKVVEALQGDFGSDRNLEGLAGEVMDILGKNEVDRTPDEQALTDWYEIFQDHIVDPKLFKSLDVDPKNLTSNELEIFKRGIDLKGLELERDKFLSNLSPEQLNYVLENTHPNRTPIEDVYIRGQRTLKRYWNIPDKHARNPRELALYEQYISMPANQKKMFAIRNRSVVRMEKLISRDRLVMRRRNRDVDDLLVTFYDSTPQNRDNMREARGGKNNENIKRRLLAGADAYLDRSLNLNGIQR
tara:strand:- start:4037 stop:7357 length:3321 start_codon:yes stop_codon:yes gene_type:complete